MDELSDFLQEPVLLVEPLDDCLVDDDSFCCLIRSPPPQGRAFQLCWEGILGMEPIDGKPDTSVVLFLYSRNRRLAVHDHAGGSFLYVVYKGSLEHGGRWTTPGWRLDEFDEYLMYESYGDD
ncbi:hypothetical protein [Streptomyces sp. I05A-00742]|uniref:hypothetical protein n=1 Tax=Streptomyces sp. I05A-00742 TaxID=2732853 RepID=UPI001489F60D|nr:hypothetical protein [Streptomyces sp. I05A-00742]